MTRFWDFGISRLRLVIQSNHEQWSFERAFENAFRNFPVIFQGAILSSLLISYGQLGSGAGKEVLNMLLSQQLPDPEKSQIKSLGGSG